MVDTTARIVKVVIWGIIVFFVTALIEGLINLFLFKRYGGCPMYKKDKKTA